MTTGPIPVHAPVRHRRAEPTPARLARAAGYLLWVAGLLAAIAIITGHPRPWLIPTVTVLVLIGVAALAVVRIDQLSRRLDDVVARLLGR